MGLAASIEENQLDERQGKKRARMRRDARDGVAYRYNKTIARRGHRLNEPKGRCVGFSGRGEHVKGFQQA
jgi:hypothetical protein